MGGGGESCLAESLKLQGLHCIDIAALQDANFSNTRVTYHNKYILLQYDLIFCHTSVG